MQVLMVMTVRSCHVNGNNMDIPMTHAAFRDKDIGESTDFLKFPAQDDGFKAGIVVEVHMHGRHCQIMVIMLQVH